MVKIYIAHREMIAKKGGRDCLWNMVNEQRRAKVLRCKNEKDQELALLAGWLLRWALEQEGLSYDKLRFAQGPKGKPYLCGEKKIGFSLSHAGDYAVCAVADTEVGVDIETGNRSVFRNASTLARMAKHAFSDAEYQRFLSLEPEEAKAFFLRTWTRMEACGKMTGEGLLLEREKMDILDEKCLSFSHEKEYDISVCVETERLRKEDVTLCMMN